MKSTDSKVVYIFNMSEDVWPFIASITNENKRAFEISENSHLADRELFTNINEKDLVFISPEPIRSSFIEYFQTLSGIKDIEILVPYQNSGRICEDVIHDKRLMNRLIQIGKSSKLIFKSYSASQHLYNLLRELKKNGVEISTPESPDEENSWTVNYYGSKSGIRQLIAKMHNPLIQMSEGLVCSGIQDAASFGASWYIHNNGLVIKTHKGHAGAGVLLYPPGELPTDYTACRLQLLEVLKKDHYWKLFPIIIENFVDTDKTISGGFPNIEYQILSDGTVKPLYYCGMRVSPEGVFMGVEIHRSVLKKELTDKLINIGNTIGAQYAKDGYRGSFEFDFAASKDGKLLITESNVRKTGGTYVYQTARKLIGENFMDESYVLSTNVYKLPEGKNYTFRSVFDLLKPLLYSPETKEGVVIASANLLNQGSFGYIIFGKDESRALQIEEEMKKLLGCSAYRT